jgi:hypothetical protein
MATTDEFVMETFVTFDKLKTVIYDLLMTEVWKEKCFPLLKKQLRENCNSIRAYMSIYHEASVCNILEVMLYHRTACMAADDVLVELIDYCYRKFVALTEKCSKLPDGEYLFPSKPT